MLRRAFLAAPLVVMAGVDPAMAQMGSTAAPATHLTPDAAASFSKQIERELAGRGARLAMVFRSGRRISDLPEGLGFTHGAFWAYQPARTEEGETRQGYAVYNLYQGDGKAMRKDRSYLRQDFPFDFVSGSVLDHVAVIIPTPEMQRRMLAVMASPDYPRLHNPSYSLVANPFDARHQNCNDFILQVIAAAAWETVDPVQLRLNLAQHFKPTVIKAGPLQKLFGPALDDGLKLDDQNVRKIITATYESIAPFMKSNGLLQDTYFFRRAV